MDTPREIGLTDKIAKRDLSDIISLMKVGGQWNDSTGSTLFWKIFVRTRHTVQVVITSLTIISIYVAGFVNSLGSVMFFSTLGVMTSMQTLSLFFNYASAIKIIKGFQEMLKKHQNNWEVDIFHKQADVIWKIKKFYMNSIFWFMVIYFAIPVIIDAILVYTNPSSKGYRVPLPLDGFLGPAPLRDFKYYLATFIGILWSFISLPSGIGNQALLCIFCVYLSTELKIFCRRLRRFGEEENARLFMGSNDKNSTAIIESKLRELIINQQEIMSISHNMNEYLGFPFAIQSVMTSICICLLLFSVMMQDPRKDVTLLLNNIFMLVAMFAMVAFTCGVGQMIETESMNISETLYDLPWYKQDPELRKYINMMLRQAVRHMKIHYRGGSPLNLRTLMQILNTSYSYFMVLKSTV